MDDVVAIAQSLNNQKVGQQYETAVAKTALESQEQTAASLLKLLDVAPPSADEPGRNIDVSA